MNNSSFFLINRRYIIFILYFLLCLTLYFVAVEILQPLKLITIVFMILGLLIFNKLSSEKIYLKPIIILWILSLFPFIVSLFYTLDFTASLQFVLIYTLTILIFILVASSNLPIQKYIFEINYYLSVSIMVITLFSYVLPSVFQSTFFPLLNETAQRAYIYFLNQGELSGISGQTGTNAFLLSVGLAFLLFNKKSFVNITLICLFLFFIIMSEKRGILLANGVAYFSVVLLFMKINYRKIIILLLLFVIFIFVIWIYLIDNPFMDIDDFSSGRIFLYKEAINIFLGNYWGGTGINTYSSQVGINTHNVYFQLISEVGLLGFLIYTTAQVFTLIYVLKLKKTVIENLEYSYISRYYLSVIYFQIFFIVYSLIGNPLYDYNFFLIYLLLIAPLLNIKSWR